MATEKSPEDLHPVKCFGWAARDTSGILSPFKFSRRATGEKDVRFKILYCGVCHSDLHCVKNEWGWTNYPLVPGHEMVGIVTEVGSKVTKCRVGDTVGMGCLCGSCRKCEQCKNDVETYCSELKMTYLSVYYDGTPTQGGYSNEMVADEHFIINWPKNLPLAAGAPLLCAGATVYSPFKYYGLDKPGTHVGIVGLGGLGHVAVKFAKAFGLKVTVISTSPSKRDEAINQLGADNFLVSRDPEAMKAAMGTLDNIFDSVSAVHPLMPLFDLLKPQGKLIMVGAPTEAFQVVAPTLIMTRKMLGWSAAAGLKETQEMINFAAEHNIAADVELIPVDYINKAMERLEKNDVRYRFVIDIANTLKEE